MYGERQIDGARVLWHSAGSGSTVLPADGCVDLILHGDEAHVAGPSTQWLTTRADGAVPTVGVRFAPGAASAVLRTDLAELRDAYVPVADVVGRRNGDAFAAGLRRMGASASPSSWSSSVGAVDLLAVDASPQATVVRSGARRGLPASAVIDELGWSERRFRRELSRRFGYGYATLVRIERARRARALLVRGIGLADVAALAGYADQPHLTREFRRLVGVTPGQFAGGAA